MQSTRRFFADASSSRKLATSRWSLWRRVEEIKGEPSKESDWRRLIASFF